MKKLLRSFFISLLALYIANHHFGGLVFEKGIETLLITSAALSITTLIGRPIINLLLLPINLVTFGIFRFLSSAVILYLVTLIVKEFRIERFYYQGLSTMWFDIPEINVEGLLAFVGFALIVSVITSFTYWIRK